MLLLGESNIYLRESNLRDSNYKKKKKYFYKFKNCLVEKNMDTHSKDYIYKDNIKTVLIIICIAKLFIF